MLPFFARVIFEYPFKGIGGFLSLKARQVPSLAALIYFT